MVKNIRFFIRCWIISLTFSLCWSLVAVSAQMLKTDTEPGFSEQFNQDIWENGWEQRVLLGNPSADYVTQTDKRLTVKIPGSDGSVILTNNNTDTADSYIEAEFENILSMEASYGVICRYSEDGWYEFRIYVSGPRAGAYTFFKYDAALKAAYKNPYVQVHAGYTQYNTMDIKLGLNVKNKLGLSCEENKFRLFINDKEQKHYKNGEMTDRSFDSGRDGVIFQTYGNNISKLDLLSFDVYSEEIQADENVAALAPTVAVAPESKIPAELPKESPKTDSDTKVVVARPLGAPPIEETAPTDVELAPIELEETPQEILSPETEWTQTPVIEEIFKEEPIETVETEPTAEPNDLVLPEEQASSNSSSEANQNSPLLRLIVGSFVPLQLTDSLFPPMVQESSGKDPAILSEPIQEPTEIPPTETPLPPTATPIPTEIPPLFFPSVQIGQKISCDDKFQFSVFWQPVMTRSLSGENAQGRFLYFRAQIENKSGQDLTELPARSFKLFCTIDGIQKEFPLHAAVSAMTSHRWSVDMLNSAMEHGKTLDTFLVFEVPENGEDWTVEFQPIATLADGPFCRIQLKLPKIDRQDL